MSKRKVAAALSGGVDSAVAALLLKDAGHEVMGMHMHLWDSSSFDDQARRAENICHILDMPYHQVDLREEFESSVVDYFCVEYQEGRTPNPCVVCNQHMKFGLLFDRALSLGADDLATGHYARVEHSRDGHRLLKAKDTGRDQSYFLYALTQEKLGRVLFPVGEHAKDEIRRMAKRAGLPIAAKSSQDICFISQKNYSGFLSERFGTTPGDVVDAQGNTLGRHQGIAFCTIGQRHGLGVASGKPLFVTKIEPEGNRIVLGPEEALYSQRLTAHRINWISGTAPPDRVIARAKIRYKSKEAEAMLLFRNDSVEVHFAQPQKAVTPGQAVVFYNGDEVLGGGTIDQMQK